MIIHEVPENFKNANYVSDKFSKTDILILAIGITVAVFIGLPPIVTMFFSNQIKILTIIGVFFRFVIPIGIAVILVSPQTTYHSLFLKIVYMIKKKRKQKIFRYERLD